MTDEPALHTTTLVLLVSRTVPYPAPHLLRHLSRCLNADHGRVHLRVLVDQTQTFPWTYRLDGPWLHPTQVHHTLAAAFSQLPSGDQDD